MVALRAHFDQENRPIIFALLHEGHQARDLRSYLVHTICIRILSHRISIGSRYLHHAAELSARKTHTRFKMPTKLPLPS